MQINQSHEKDEYWMAKAIELAWQGKYTTTPNPRVGCILVDNSQNIIGCGAHLKAGDAHAEIHALHDAGHIARGATAYVTLEPCSYTGRTPPCANALIKAGVSRVVIANTDPNPKVSGNGIRALKDNSIAVTSGVLAKQAARLNEGFFKRMLTGRPYVRIKMAASLDGRTALGNGKSKWITGDCARQDVQRYRAMSCAILTGRGTVEADDPSLLVRAQQARFDDYPELPLRQPLRIVIDSEGQLSPDFTVFTDKQKTVLATCSGRPDVNASENIDIWQIAELNGHVCLASLLQKMGDEGINDLWTECGASLAGSLIEKGLYDELIVYIAPKLIGASGFPMFQLPQYQGLEDVPQLVLQDTHAVGQDIRLTYVRKKT